MLLNSVLVKIDKDGWLFSILFGIITVVLYFFHKVLGHIGFILTLWCIYFFRDPNRVTPTNKDLIISPADGIIQSVTKTTTLPKEFSFNKKSKWTRISIFMSVFDVHVNRIPISGRITAIHYCPGKFFNASLDKSSIYNERNSIVITTKNNVKIPFVQIAGLIARRIRCDIKNGENVKVGERMGMIRFGSRLDVYLPEGIVPAVIEGQRAISGETILADLLANKAA